MLYTVQASDDLIGRQYLEKIYEKNGVKQDIMNTMEFDCQTSNIDEIIDYCFTTPFFAAKKVTILKNPIFLTAESDRKDYTYFIDRLMEYIKNENEQTIFIIYSLYDKLDERKKVLKFLKENTTYKKIDSPNPLQLAKIVAKMIEKNGCTMDIKDISYIIERVGNNLVDLRLEIDKLTTFKPNSHIYREDLDDFMVYNIDTTIFDLSNAILDGNTSLALTLFDELIKSGFEPIVLISVLSNQFRIALLAKSYQRLSFDQPSIAKKLKIHPYRIKLALKLTFSDKDIKDNLVKLAKLDYQIKIGKINKYHGMKLFILSI